VLTIDEVAAILAPRIILTSYENQGGSTKIATLDGMRHELADEAAHANAIGPLLT
jgi:hypothetical protein